MANTESAKKEYRKSLKRRLVNRSKLSQIKTLEKKILNLVSLGAKSDALALFPKVQSAIAKGIKKVLKKNTASRKISRISRKVKACQQI